MMEIGGRRGRREVREKEDDEGGMERGGEREREGEEGEREGGSGGREGEGGRKGRMRER